MWRVARRMQRPTLGRRFKYSRFGLTGGVAIVVVILTLLAAWVLDWRGASDSDRQLAELATRAAVEPNELLLRAARANRVVFLSDIPGSAVVKQFAARLIGEIAGASGLDAVVLEIGSDQQGYIDQYLDRDQEDASILVARSRAIRDAGAAGRAYLDIFRSVWQLNRELGPDQRIRIVAADLPGWTTGTALSPSQATRRMEERVRYMETRIGELRASIPRARVFVFMGGLLALRGGTIALQTGGTAPVSITPLAARLGGQEIFTALVDAPAGALPATEIAPYTGTRVAAILERQGIQRRFASYVGRDFDYLRQPILERKALGIEFDILPRDYELRAVADAYINLGR